MTQALTDPEAYTLLGDAVRILAKAGVGLSVVRASSAEDVASDIYIEFRRRGLIAAYDPTTGVPKDRYVIMWARRVLLDFSRKTPQGRELNRQRMKKIDATPERKQKHKEYEKTRKKRDRSEYMKAYRLQQKILKTRGG